MKIKMFKLVSFAIVVLMILAPLGIQRAMANNNTPTTVQTLGVNGLSPVEGSGVQISGELNGGKDPSRYIIQFKDPSVSLYQGGISGLKATSPEALGTTTLDTTSPDALAFADYLNSQHDAFRSAAEQRLGHSLGIIHQYVYAFNGMTVNITAAEASELRSMPGVKSVNPDSAFEPTTDASPSWIGATSIWDGSNTGSLPGTQGEGVIVGILDTGINMDHPSFADEGDDGYNHTNPLGHFVGWCNPAEPEYDPTLVCNDKLIGVWRVLKNGTG